MIERVSLLIKNNIFKISIILSIFILYTSFCIFIYYFFNVNKQSYENASNNISASIIDVENKISEEKEEYIYIDIKGEVKKPNVYKVLKNSRTIDQTTPNMIQRISGIFERNPLISKEI